MITGIGTDLVEVARVQKAIGRSSFLERIYTEKERELITARPARAAGNFAAKEAVSKALGCGFAGLAPAEIEVLRMPSGLPYVILHGRAKKRAEEQGVCKVQISITDTAEYAQAYAVCEGEGIHTVCGTGTKQYKGEITAEEAKQPVLDAEGMRTADNRTIHEIGLSSSVLMERAALAVAGCVKEYTTEKSRIGVLCGTGNNGGDGAAVARLLKAEGFDVEILLFHAQLYQTENLSEAASEKGKNRYGTEEFLQQIKLARAYGVPVCEPEDTGRYDIIVDALFGIGLSKPVEGGYAALLEQINRESHMVIAVDIASGLSATTGAVCGVALRADETVTFGAVKCGHLLYHGKEYTGRLRVADIGFPRSLLWELRRGIYFAPEGMDAVLPKRPVYSNKGTFGTVAVIAGSKNMAGAAYFAACAAYRTGAGLVRIVSPECNREILQTLLPEAMLTTYSNVEDVRRLAKNIVQSSDALVIGPGLGQTEDAKELVCSIREELVKTEETPPSVWDADGLNLIARMMREASPETEEERCAFMEAWFPKKSILTPHPGELSRLLGTPVKELTGNLSAVAKRLSRQSELTFVLKDAVTLVADKEECFFNTTGNNGMAAGGSGDILCGVIAAFLAAGLGCFKAAAAGVWLHGAAGDAAAEKIGKTSMIARDILNAIGELGKEVIENENMWDAGK